MGVRSLRNPGANADDPSSEIQGSDIKGDSQGVQLFVATGDSDRVRPTARIRLAGPLDARVSGQGQGALAPRIARRFWALRKSVGVDGFGDDGRIDRSEQIPVGLPGVEQ